jgi:hypothetical protein
VIVKVVRVVARKIWPESKDFGISRFVEAVTIAIDELFTFQ